MFIDTFDGTFVELIPINLLKSAFPGVLFIPYLWLLLAEQQI